MPAAVKRIKSSKAQDSDLIDPEFIINCGAIIQKWLGEVTLPNTPYLQKIWHRADVSVVVKPKKPADGVKNYHPISLHCMPLFEHLLLKSVEHVIDTKLPPQ